MSTLVSLPVIIIVVILQMAVFSRLNLLSGTADIMLLVVCSWALQEKSRDHWVWAILGGLAVGWISAIPWYIPIIIYSAVSFFARILQKHTWQMPILSMFLLSTLGTLLMQVVTMIMLQFMVTSAFWKDAFLLVVLPSALLNLLFSLPVYLIMTDISKLIHRSEER